MIFGWKDEQTTLIVGAADATIEMDEFYRRANEAGGFLEEFQPSVTDMMMDDRFQGFRKPPYVFTFDGAASLGAFAEKFGISILPWRQAVLEKQRDMIAAEADDPYVNDQRTIEEIHGLEENDPWDKRTDEEKEKDKLNEQQAEEAKKAGKLSGDSSFGPKKRKKKGAGESDIGITDIRAFRDEDGQIVIDDVLAVKGDVYEDNRKGLWKPADAVPVDAPVVSAARDAIVLDAEPGEQFYRFASDVGFGGSLDAWLDVLGELPDTAEMSVRDRIVVAEDLTDHTFFVVRGERLAHKLAYWLDTLAVVDMAVVDAALNLIEQFVPNPEIAQWINPDGYIAIYQRLDIMGHCVDAVVDVIKAESANQNKDLLASNIAARGFIPSYTWLACATRLGAETIEGVLKAHPSFADAEFEIYGVNDKGERLVPKGAATVITEEVEVEPPRPWNDRAAEWAAMDSAARKKDDVRIRGKEFIFCGTYNGPQDGVVVYIAVRSIFRATGEMWDQPLSKVVNLPEDLKETSPGVFRTKSRDYINLSQDLNKRGMVESLALQLYLNQL